MSQRMAGWWTAAALALLTSVGAMWAHAQAQTPAPAPASNGRVAIVDIQRILARSVAGAAAREQLEKDKAGMQRQLDGQKVELEKMRDELEKKGQLLSADARREKKEDALLQKVLQDVAGLIQRLGKEKGFAVVVERQRAGVLYASTDADLTDDVLKAYDDQTKKATK